MEEHCYIVCFDLINPDKDYSDFFNSFKTFKSFGQLTLSSYMIISNMKINEITDFFLRFIDNSDKIIVIQSGKSAAWTQVLSDDCWIKRNIIK